MQYVEPDPAQMKQIVALYQQGRFAEGEQAAAAFASLHPSHPFGWKVRGLLLRNLNRLEEAEQSYQRALALAPQDAELLSNLAACQLAQKRHQDAADSCEAALRINPANAGACVNLGNAYSALDRLEQAEASYRAALALAPDHAEALSNLGSLLQRRGQLEEASVCLQRAIAARPGFVEAHVALGGVAKSLGRLDAAMASYRTALALEPRHVGAWNSLLFAMVYAEKVRPAELAQAAREFGELFALPLRRPSDFANPREAGRKLKIGYVSGDLRDHAVCYSIEPVLEAHDRSQFELFAYANNRRDDAVSLRLRKHFACWRNIVDFSDEQAARQIEIDGIDILVDLSGHTDGNRLLVFARKPAPVQVAWLGYPASTGLAAMDYRISDGHVEPPGMTEQYNVEALWRLPEAYACYHAPKSSPDVIGHPPMQDNGYPTFGCFNNFSKVTDAVIALWAKVLERSPGARLMLEIWGVGEPRFRAEVARRFACRGVGADRLILIPRERANQYVLYNQIDIALDPFPCNGGTTSLDTLWMGVPLVTLAGAHFVSRMGVTLLANAGLSQLVAATEDEYVAIASGLANDPARLARLRSGLRQRVQSSPLMDAPRFTRHLEQAYRAMWQQWLVRDDQGETDGAQSQENPQEKTGEARRADPDPAQMNQLVALFQERRFAEGEAAAAAFAARHPSHPFGWKVWGLMLRNLGRLQEAEQCYQHALMLAPQDAELFSNLAACQLEQKRHQQAADSCEAALRLNPANLGACINLGNACNALGRLERAEASYRAALALAPEHAEALSNLGSLLQQRGELEEASVCLRHAIAAKPGFAEPRNTLGVVYKQQGRWQEALACFLSALDLLPGMAAAHLNLAALRRVQGDLAQAEHSYRAALSSEPGNGVALTCLAVVLREQGRMTEAHALLLQALAHDPGDLPARVELANVLAGLGRLAEAESSARGALQADPGMADAHNVLGTVLRLQRRLDEAAASLERALEIQPAMMAAHNNLGAVRAEQGRWEEAEASYRAALAAKPDSLAAMVNLGGALMSQGRFEEAEAAHRAALVIDPADTDARDSLLFALNFNPAKSAAERLRDAVDYGAMVAAKVKTRFSRWQCAPSPARLRVGLVSGDLRSHPVGYFLESVLRELDPQRIELIAYSTDHRVDVLSMRIRPRFAAWKSLVGLSDAEAAHLIHGDGVHVLLDLAGHTAKNRLPVFAWKPAPVQAAWLGYFATTGVAEIDWLLADRIGVPEGQSQYFTEKIHTLPHTRLCFTPPESAPGLVPPPALANGFVTFGCFQVLTKVGPDVLALWARILAALPQARLRLQCKQLADPAIRERLERRLRQHGIDPLRVSMFGPVERDDYLAAHAQVDIILDTFPFPGGTTSCEALWMGVPTVTLAGQSLLERQGASLLAAAGLSDFVAADQDAYVAKALAVAVDLPALVALRQDLRRRMLASPLCDAARFARDFEAALDGMWRAGAQLGYDALSPTKD